MSISTYTNKGVTKAVKAGWFQGQKCYIKSNLTPSQIDKYLFLEQKGLGVKILSFDKAKGQIVMEGGITLFQLIKEKRITNQDQMNQIYNQLTKVMLLSNYNLQHTDIKPQNIAFKKENNLWKGFLIDNDDVTQIGSIRQVGTPGWNCSKDKLFNKQKVTNLTDRVGYVNSVEFVNMYHIKFSDGYSWKPSYFQHMPMDTYYDEKEKRTKRYGKFQ